MTNISTPQNSTDIGIVFSADNYYVPYMSTAIQSIMENASADKQYHIYVLYQDISQQSKEQLRGQVAAFSQFAIDFVEAKQYVEGYKFFSSRWSVETYFRLLIPYLFPERKKMIYLDGDIICNVDIAELYEVELGENLLACVRDYSGTMIMCGTDEREKEIYQNEHQIFAELKNPDDYFNAGVQVFNSEAFRNTISMPDLLAFTASRAWQIVDQDVLNVLCEGKVMFLPIDWNFPNCNSNLANLPKDLQQAYIAARERPKLVHLIWKPWRAYTDLPSIRLFFAYAFKTPFIETILTRIYNINPNVPIKKRVLSEIENKNIGLRFLVKCLVQWAKGKTK
ncbi:MAG: glycosyltransferase family 8 protein [Prevotellaceae bacterium]|nr:glycosyltransferase family 8 protein [Prevotellaceae bacterium]